MSWTDWLVDRIPGRASIDLSWITPTLAVSGSVSDRALRRLPALGIRALLDLQAEGVDQSAPARELRIAYLRLAVEDFRAPSVGQLALVAEWLLDRQAEGPVLVHCRAGLGRSITAAIAALLSVGYDLPQAYRLVRKARGAVALTDTQLAALARFASTCHSNAPSDLRA